MVFGANFAQTGQPTSFGQYEYLGINVPSYGLQKWKQASLPPSWYFCNIDAAKKIKIETGKENGF
jgi:hypothetical protein